MVTTLLPPKFEQTKNEISIALKVKKYRLIGRKFANLTAIQISMLRADVFWLFRSTLYMN